MIVDVRDNGGGSTQNSDSIAGRFADAEYLFAYYRDRNGPDHDDTRILRDLSPPRIALHYRHADAAGRTLAQGEAVLTDPAYLQAGAGMATASDPLRHEKRLLRDWVRSLAGHRRP